MNALRLVYLGNLGMAHDVPLLETFLLACAERVPVEVTFIGTGRASLIGLLQSAARAQIAVTLEGHMPFDQLPKLIPPRQFAYGMVSLNRRFWGLLSPSKFSGYLAGGLPVVYLGPPAVNTALVCDDLGAGIRIDSAELADPTRRQVAVGRVLDPACRARCAGRVPAALAYFDQFNGDYLAREIAARVPLRR